MYIYVVPVKVSSLLVFELLFAVAAKSIALLLSSPVLQETKTESNDTAKMLVTIFLIDFII